MYLLVDTEQAWQALETAIARLPCGIVGFDTETTGVGWTDTLVGVSVATEPGTAFYLPLAHHPEETLFVEAGADVNFAQRAADLFALLASVPSVAHNALFDYEKCREAGYEVNIQHDSMVEVYLDDAAQHKGLKEAARRYLQMEMREYRSLFPKGRGERRIDRLNPQGEERAALTEYACADADAALRLHLLLYEKIMKECGALYETENKNWHVVADMRRRGIMLDLPKLKLATPLLEAKIAGLEEEVIAAARTEARRRDLILTEDVFEINVNAPEQVAGLFFDKLAIPALGGSSTAEEYLTPLAEEFPCVAALLAYRDTFKLLHSFVAPMPGYVCSDGAVRAGFKPYHTRAGRYSCEMPNLQQLPKFDEMGVRKAFVARPGYYFVDADYSQIEIRVFACLAGDQNVLQALEAGADFHTLTAQKMFHLARPEEVTKEQRQRGKTMNFAQLYGQSDFGMAKALGIEVEEAKRLIESYFRAMPGVAKFIAQGHREAERDGAIRTYFGRKRTLPEVTSDEPRARNRALRQAINSRIQGSAADIMKAALVRLWERLPEIGAYLLLTVHDQVLIEVPEEVPFYQAEALVRECMEIAVPGWCRLPVDATAGYRWGEEDRELMARGAPEPPPPPPPPEPEPEPEPEPAPDVRRGPRVIWHVPRMDKKLAAILGRIRDCCQPEAEASYELYVQTRIGDEELTIESRRPIAVSPMFWQYLKRLALRGMVCRVLDGEGNEIERRHY